MGTKAHAPHRTKKDWHGLHDDGGKALGPGERPGVPGRLGAARAKLRGKDAP